jgi:hypothetical protein
LADLAGVTHKSAIKLLLLATEDDENIESKEHHWIDKRFRQRKKQMYRRRGISKSDQAALLNSILGFKLPATTPPPTTVHRLGD